jgi:hypothetical protein
MRAEFFAPALPPTNGQTERPVSADPSKAPPVEALLVDTAAAAAMCGNIGLSTWYRLKAARRTPAAVKLGGRTLYRVADLRLWAELGCPAREEFEARKTNRRR